MNKVSGVVALACCSFVALACSNSEDASPGAGGAQADAGDAASDAPTADTQPDSPDADAEPPVSRPSVDGLFDEWTDANLVASDPAGDGTSVFDVTGVWATSRGASVYLRLQIASQPVNLQAGWTGETPLRVEVGLPGERSLQVDLRQHTVRVDGAQALRWSGIGFQLAPTTAATEVEMKLDLSGLGVAQGDTITLDFSGSDALDAPASLVLLHDALDPERRDPARAAGTAFRIASLNVEFDGLTEPGRAEPMGRLLHAAAADIYCLQEVWDTPASVIAARLAEIDPHGDNAIWNVHRTGDTAIATRAALTPFDHGFAGAPFTAGGVEISAGVRLMVFTLRPTCCGFIDDPSDTQRIAEMQKVADAILALRAGSYGATLEPFVDAPVIVIGDWNLVGSNTPLDLMTDPSGPALERWLLRHLVGDGAVYTWRNDALDTFAPGALDVLAHGGVSGGSSLKPLAGFVLDSAQLDASMLGDLGLQSGDSLSTDHLLLVADFGL